MPVFVEKKRIERNCPVNSVYSGETAVLLQTDQANYGASPTFSRNIPNSYSPDKCEYFKKAFIERFKFQIESCVRESIQRKENPSKSLSLIYTILAGLVGTVIGFFFQLEGKLLSKFLYQLFAAIGIMFFSIIFSKILYFHEYRMLKKSQQRAKRISGVTYFLRNDPEQFKNTLLEVGDAIFLKFEKRIDALEGYRSGGLDVAMNALAKAAVGRAMNYFDKNADSLQRRNIDKDELVKAILSGEPEKKGIVRKRAGDKLYFQKNNKLIKVRAGDLFSYPDTTLEDTI